MVVLVKIVKSPGSATIINAIATGYGSAFGIDLSIKAEARFGKPGIQCSSDLGADPKLMNICVKNVLNHYDIAADNSLEDSITNLDFGTGEGIEIKTESNLPLGSGLSSSSALSNAVVKAASSLIESNFNLKPLSDMELINLGIESSLEAGVTITGAFDDASASYFGGITITDNSNRKLLARDTLDDENILVFMPDKESLSGSSDVSRMKLIAPLVEMAFENAMNKEYYKALTLNGLLYGSVLNFDNNIAIEALDAGALASGLSGTGSSFVAIAKEDRIDDIKDAWAQFDGNVIETKANNEGTCFI